MNWKCSREIAFFFHNLFIFSRREPLPGGLPLVLVGLSIKRGGGGGAAGGDGGDGGGWGGPSHMEHMLNLYYVFKWHVHVNRLFQHCRRYWSGFLFPVILFSYFCSYGSKPNFMFFCFCLKCPFLIVCPLQHKNKLKLSIFQNSDFQHVMFSRPDFQFGVPKKRDAKATPTDATPSLTAEADKAQTARNKKPFSWPGSLLFLRPWGRYRGGH